MHKKLQPTRNQISRRRFLKGVTLTSGALFLESCHLRLPENLNPVAKTTVAPTKNLPAAASPVPTTSVPATITQIPASRPTRAPSLTPTPTPVFSYENLSTSLSADEVNFLASHEVIQGDTTRPVVLMSYDDTINDLKLNHLLDVYAEAKAKTSFFFIGEDLQNVAKTIPRVVEEGHSVGFHGWIHVPLVGLSDQDVNDQFKQFTEAIDQILPGYRVHYFRAPYGARNDRIRKIGAQWGMQHILWSLESGGTTKATYHNVVDRVIDGSVVLSHAIRYYDVKDAAEIVAGVINKGYKLENLDTGRAPKDVWKG